MHPSKARFFFFHTYLFLKMAPAIPRLPNEIWTMIYTIVYKARARFQKRIQVMNKRLRYPGLHDQYACHRGCYSLVTTQFEEESDGELRFRNQHALFWCEEEELVGMTSCGVNRGLHSGCYHYPTGEVNIREPQE
jgi:hypothetical protein